eukprot:11379412-Ditylum_brightwellii.AAC.1
MLKPVAIQNKMWDKGKRVIQNIRERANHLGKCRAGLVYQKFKWSLVTSATRAAFAKKAWWLR